MRSVFSGWSRARGWFVRGRLAGGVAAAGLLAGLASPGSAATNYVFDVEYLGNDNAQLAPGSDDPVGAMLLPGDTFQWTIASADARFWRVETGGDFFPFMAFGVNPAGVRVGDFSLVLRNDGGDVFSLIGTDVTNQEVHLGTNTVTLPTGLDFDEMFLDYSLDSADDLGQPPTPANTTLEGLLPIFGAPEQNQFSPGIVFIPEPGVAALGMAALVLVGRVRRD